MPHHEFDLVVEDEDGDPPTQILNGVVLLEREVQVEFVLIKTSLEYVSYLSSSVNLVFWALVQQQAPLLSKRSRTANRSLPIF